MTWDNRNAFAAADVEPDRRIDYVMVGYPREHGVGQITSARVISTRRRRTLKPWWRSVRPIRAGLRT